MAVMKLSISRKILKDTWIRLYSIQHYLPSRLNCHLCASSPVYSVHFGPICTPLESTASSSGFFPPTKSGLSCANFACLSSKVCSVKQSKQSKFDTWCISNLDHPQNHVFFVQIMYQPGHVFLKQGRIMLLKVWLNWGASGSKEVCLCSPPSSVSRIMNSTFFKFLKLFWLQTAWNFTQFERNFRKLGWEAPTIGALRGQSRVHFLCVARWMFTFSHPARRHSI